MDSKRPAAYAAGLFLWPAAIAPAILILQEFMQNSLQDIDTAWKQDYNIIVNARNIA